MWSTYAPDVMDSSFVCMYVCVTVSRIICNSYGPCLHYINSFIGPNPHRPINSNDCHLQWEQPWNKSSLPADFTCGGDWEQDRSRSMQPGSKVKQNAFCFVLFFFSLSLSQEDSAQRAIFPKASASVIANTISPNLHPITIIMSECGRVLKRTRQGLIKETPSLI